MSRASRTQRWRLAALLSTGLTLGLGLASWRAARAAHPSPQPSLAQPRLAASPRPARASAASDADTPEVERSAWSLLAALGSASDPREQTKLIVALGETADQAVLEPLIGQATRGEDEPAQAALLALAKLGGVRAREFLERRFGEVREGELAPVALALATLGGHEAREFLRGAARSTRSGARDAALVALGTLDAPDVREFMLFELRASAPRAATAYFGDCVDPNALPALQQLAQSSESELGAQAVTALVAQGPSAHASLTELLQGETETANAVLAAAKDVLRLRPVLEAASIARLRAGAITSGPAFAYLAEDLSQRARAALMAAARDPGSANSAIDALASRGDPASLQALNELSRDQDPEVAALALCAQFRDPDSRARSALLAVRGDGTRAAATAALASIDAPEAAPALEALRRSEQASERREAAALLGRFGSRDAEYELRELAKDPEYEVVAASLSALSQLGADATLRELASREDLPSFSRDYAQNLLERRPKRFPR